MRKSAADRHTQRRLQRLSRRALLLGAAQAGGFLVLAGRMYQLQVQEADRYRTLADKNRIGLRLEVATRGLILDRYDRPMALNQTAYRVAVVPEEAGDLQRLLERLDRLVPLTEEQRERVLVTARRQRSFLPIIAYEDLTWQEIARIGVHTADLPGVEVSETKQRVYPEGEVAAHLVGYVGAVSEQELTADPVLALPDFRIGKSGVERIYDRQLRGEAGRRQVEVNAVGRTIRDLRRIPETPGENLQLSIDVKLQKLGVERFGEQTGAAVVMNVHTGEILSLVSRPSYDPGLFVGGISRQDWERLIKAPDAPLVNKAIAGQYAPGSTFKMIVALAALE